MATAKRTSRRADRRVAILLVCALTFGFLAAPRVARAQQLRVGDICRVKGQEENTLHGQGLVVGLNGTGDSETPTIRALAKMLELMGNPVSQDNTGKWNIDELSNTRNVALVTVTATIPRGGARQGDSINCEVNAISAKSLAGGFLMMTPLLGPRPGNPRLYAFCSGPIALAPKGPPTAGKIHKGCRLEEDFRNAFAKEGKITLVLDNAHASFQTAFLIADQLVQETAGFWESSSEGDDRSVVNAASEVSKEEGPVRARAVDQVNIEVLIPPVYAQSPVEFVAIVLDMRIVPPNHDALVVIDKRSGVIIVGKDVTVGKVAVSHNNISVQTGEAPGDGPLFVLDQSGDTTRTHLDALVRSLNALRLNSEDIISIIENLDEGRALHGRLIVR